MFERYRSQRRLGQRVQERNVLRHVVWNCFCAIIREKLYHWSMQKVCQRTCANFSPLGHKDITLSLQQFLLYSAKRVRSISTICAKIIAMRAETNSNDFGFFFLELISRFEFDFLRREIFFERFEFLVVKVQSHTIWPYVCVCCGLFVPTQFHFECCGVRDDMYIYI